MSIVLFFYSNTIGLGVVGALSILMIRNCYMDSYLVVGLVDH